MRNFSPLFIDFSSIPATVTAIMMWQRVLPSPWVQTKSFGTSGHVQFGFLRRFGFFMISVFAQAWETPTRGQMARQPMRAQMCHRAHSGSVHILASEFRNFFWATGVLQFIGRQSLQNCAVIGVPLEVTVIARTSRILR